MQGSKPMLVCFKANNFNSTTVKDYFINDYCFGDDVCKWLISEFTSAGCKCDKKPAQEDFGWFFSIYSGKDKHRLLCGLQVGDDYANVGNWLVWIDHPTNFMSSLFGGAHKNFNFELLKVLHKILSESLDVSEIKWFTKDDFDRGDESHPQDAPT